MLRSTQDVSGEKREFLKLSSHMNSVVRAKQYKTRYTTNSRTSIPK